jgi:hypothetical protein
MGKMAIAAIGGILASLILVTPGSAEVTIGADVTQTPSTSGTCAYNDSEVWPCVVVTTWLPGPPVTSTCDGTITRFRLNGFVRPGNSYRLRVVRMDGDGTFTTTASSAPVVLGIEGVNEFATSLPVKTGEYIGLDFQNSTEDFGLRRVGTSPTMSARVFRPFPADLAVANGFGEAAYYLYNADVLCAGEPSNVFTVLGVTGRTLKVEVNAAGAVRLTELRAKATSSSLLKPSPPALLKPSSASGGPGTVAVPLRLTAAAKKKLDKNGKFTTFANVTFTPTGGRAATEKVLVKVTRPKKKPRR